ncbi:MAG: chemotaxis protein MotA [Alphaproteobacteria bacterium]|nr:chemotaxis protein MotA [Alphaproteobacteria bacterium]
MNPSAVLGMIVGSVIVGAAIWATASDALVFINIPGFALVLGGTIAATLMSFPPRYIFRVWRSFLVALKNERAYDTEDVNEVVRIAKLWHNAQIGKVETVLANIRSPFLRSGIQLIIDGASIDEIMDLLEWRITRLKAKEASEANVFRTMGMYAPAFGMLGTLLGLVNMLYDMGSEGLELIGLNMALALITTFYGLILANLIFKPVAAMLEERTKQRVRNLSMVVEAIHLLSEKRTPAYIRETLNSFLTEYEDELDDSRSFRLRVQEKLA